MSRIGFVLLTHSKPHQIQRLVTRLNTMFDMPPIVIHHDFGKCPLTDDLLPPNVSFVRPHFNTGWAKFTVVAGTLQAIKQLFGLPDAPEWCVVLSGSCYPSKPPAQILDNLTAGGFDAHIYGRQVNLAAPDDDWHQERYRRYGVKRLDIPIPTVSRKLRPKIRVPRLPDALGKPLLPFSSTFHCYAGSQWFTLSRRAAAYVHEFLQTPLGAALTNQYKDLKFYGDERFPEESFFQTILCNAPSLKINLNNWVYVDWTERKAHPKALTLSDLPAIQSSPAQFARKIDIDTDSDLLDALDRLVDAKADAPEKVSA